jgi:hypothetical protein
MEDLKGIRTRVKVRHPQRGVLHSWGFSQLRQMIAYKAAWQESWWSWSIHATPAGRARSVATVRRATEGINLSWVQLF